MTIKYNNLNISQIYYMMLFMFILQIDSIESNSAVEVSTVNKALTSITGVLNDTLTNGQGIEDQNNFIESVDIVKTIANASLQFDTVSEGK